MFPLRQSTNGQVLSLGLFVDDSDGKTPETLLSIANTDIKIRKGGATSEANKNSGGATHIAGGEYHSTFDATDTNTLGPGYVRCIMSGALPVRIPICVYTANVYDSIFAGSDKLQVDAVEAAEAFLLLVADYVWDEDRSSHQTLNTFGEAFGSSDSGQAQAGSSTTITLKSGAPTTGIVGAQVYLPVSGQSRIAIAYDTGTKVVTVDRAWDSSAVPTTGTDYEVYPLGINPVSFAAILLNSAISGFSTTGTVGKLLQDIYAAVDTEVASILDAIDTEIAAIKAKTDSLTFTNAGKVDASLQAAADVTTAAANVIADHTIRRNLANARAAVGPDAVTKRSLLGVGSKLTNRTNLNSGTNQLEVYDETDTGTPFFTQAASRDPNAAPVTQLQ